jgi:WD40 repeat protein
VWDLAGAGCTAVLEGHTHWVTSVSVTGDGRTAVSGSHDRTVRVWDLAGGRCSAVLVGHTSLVTSVSVTGDGRTAVSGSHDRTVRVWDLAGGRCSASHATGSEEARRAWATANSGLAATSAGCRAVLVAFSTIVAYSCVSPDSTSTVPSPTHAKALSVPAGAFRKDEELPTWTNRCT